jgi:hypothetical protein
MQKINLREVAIKGLELVTILILWGVQTKGTNSFDQVP